MREDVGAVSGRYLTPSSLQLPLSQPPQPIFSPLPLSPPMNLIPHSKIQKNLNKEFWHHFIPAIS